MQNKTTICVAICTKNREKELIETIGSITKQITVPDSLIVVDDGNASDETNKKIKRIIKRKTNYKYIRKSAPGLTKSRNIAAKNSKDDILLFIDDDITLDKDYIQSIMQIFEKDIGRKIGGVGGVIQNDICKRSFLGDILVRLFLLNSRRPVILPSGKQGMLDNIDKEISAKFLQGGNMAFRREVFKDFLFDEEYEGYGLHEDLDFSHRVSKKYRLIISPKAKLVHRGLSGTVDNPRNFGLMETYYFYLFFSKNRDKKIKNYACFCWALFGTILINLLFFLAHPKNKNFEKIIGNICGIKEIIKKSIRNKKAK